MGTRSLIKFYEDEKCVAAIYTQFDGYPSGVGKQLSNLINSGTMVKGIPFGENKHFFNGVGCLAAQYVAKYKDSAGNVYLTNAEAKDVGEEYEYIVCGGYTKDWQVLPLTITVKDDGKTVFKGDTEAFAKFIKTESERNYD